MAKCFISLYCILFYFDFNLINQINAESRVGTLKIVRELDDLDQKLRCLEEEGRVLEEKIRAGNSNTHNGMAIKDKFVLL